MAVRGSAVHMNHNPTLYICRVISPSQFTFFIMDDCLGHIFKSTKQIEMKIGLQIDKSKRKGVAQEP